MGPPCLPLQLFTIREGASSTFLWAGMVLPLWLSVVSCYASVFGGKFFISVFSLLLLCP